MNSKKNTGGYKNVVSDFFKNGIICNCPVNNDYEPNLRKAYFYIKTSSQYFHGKI